MKKYPPGTLMTVVTCTGCQEMVQTLAVNGLFECEFCGKVMNLVNIHPAGSINSSVSR